MSNITFEPLVLHRGAADWGLPMTHIITRQGDDPYNRAVTIAEIPSVQPYCMGASPEERRYADTQLAYATLFTAAPALLDALEKADSLIENLWKAVPWGQTYGLDIMALNETPLAIKRAIALARGQNHPASEGGDA